MKKIILASVFLAVSNSALAGHNWCQILVDTKSGGTCYNKTYQLRGEPDENCFYRASRISKGQLDSMTVDGCNVDNVGWVTAIVWPDYLNASPIFVRRYLNGSEFVLSAPQE